MSFGKLLAGKAPFLAAVFATLAVQLLITFGVVAYLRRGTPDAQAMAAKLHKWTLLLVVAFLVLGITLVLVPMGMVTKLVLMTCLSAITGAVLGVVVRQVPEDVLRSVLLSTVGVFAAMTVIGAGLAATGVDLSLAGFALLIGTIGLLIAQVVMSFFEDAKGMRRTAATIAVVLFSLWVAYDTNTILQRNYNGDFVSAALDYYLDFVSLFDSLAAVTGNTS